MADTEYYFAGDHADTLYQGDNCIPIGDGDIVTLSTEDVDNEANAHLFENNVLLPVPPPEKAATSTSKAEKEVKK